MKIKKLKIDQKKYVWDLSKAYKMTLYYAIIFSIKARLFIFMDQVCNNYNFATFAVY